MIDLTGIVTRLYPYGEDDLDIGSVNDGLTYIDGLRHTNASLLIAQGTNLKTVSARLGHTNISTTLDIYTHALRKADMGAAAQLDGLFQKKETSGNKDT